MIRTSKKVMGDVGRSLGLGRVRTRKEKSGQWNRMRIRKCRIRRVRMENGE